MLGVGNAEEAGTLNWISSSANSQAVVANVAAAPVPQLCVNVIPDLYLTHTVVCARACRGLFLLYECLSSETSQ